MTTRRTLLAAALAFTAGLTATWLAGFCRARRAAVRSHTPVPYGDWPEGWPQQ